MASKAAGTALLNERAVLLLFYMTSIHALQHPYAIVLCAYRGGVRDLDLERLSLRAPL